MVDQANLRDRLERVANALQSEAAVTADPLRRVALFCASSNVRLRALGTLDRYDAIAMHRALVVTECEAQTMIDQGGPQ
jgi:hypothetical protein